MICREFEDKMSQYFFDADIPSYKEAIITSSLDKMVAKNDYHKLLLEHVAHCSDCSNSLWQYLETRGQIDYHKYSCFHIAYFSNSQKDRFIVFDKYNFSISMVGNPNIQCIIGFCPWCGVEINIPET
jgi:hypothetical protein